MTSGVSLACVFGLTAWWLAIQGTQSNSVAFLSHGFNIKNYVCCKDTKLRNSRVLKSPGNHFRKSPDNHFRKSPGNHFRKSSDNHFRKSPDNHFRKSSEAGDFMYILSTSSLSVLKYICTLLVVIMVIISVKQRRIFSTAVKLLFSSIQESADFLCSTGWQSCDTFPIRS